MSGKQRRRLSISGSGGNEVTIIRFMYLSRPFRGNTIIYIMIHPKGEILSLLCLLTQFGHSSPFSCLVCGIDYALSQSLANLYLHPGGFDRKEHPCGCYPPPFWLATAPPHRFGRQRRQRSTLAFSGQISSVPTMEKTVSCSSIKITACLMLITDRLPQSENILGNHCFSLSLGEVGKLHFFKG